MGLPQTIITFQALAETLVRRTQNGVVAILLEDDAAPKTLYEYTDYEQVGSEFSTSNKKYLKMVFQGNPRKVYAAKIGTTTPALTDALKTLTNRNWDYLTYPAAEASDNTAMVSWLKTQRDTNKKTYKLVAGKLTSPDHEGIINFTSEEITVGLDEWTPEQFTARIAGIIAGIGTESSTTNYEISEINSFKDLADDTARNTAINNGELILYNNGERIVIARGVNSLQTIGTGKNESFKKIRIIEIIDTIHDDIEDVIGQEYKGKVLNTYNNKLLLVAAINTYLSTLVKEDVLDSNFTNVCEIDLEAQRKYLQAIGVKVDALSNEEILKYNTNDQVFLMCKIKTVDAMEDFTIRIFM